MRHTHLLAALALAGLALSGCAAKSPDSPVNPSSAEAGHIVIGPYVQPAGFDMGKSLNVIWWTDAAGPAVLTWTADGSKAGGSVAAEQTTYEGLTRNVARVNRARRTGEGIHYVASSTIDGKRYASPSQAAAFTPSKGQSFRFAATGDEGAGNEAERNIAVQIAAHNPSLVLIAGDVVYGQGDWAEYRKNLFPQWGDVMRSVPILPALGNHDVGSPKHRGDPYRHVWTVPDNWSPGDAKGPYTILRRRANSSEGPLPADQWSLRNYSVDAGGVHFLCLDSTADRDTLANMVVPWAKADLASARKRGQKWIVAFWHHPPYTHGAYRDSSAQWQDMRDLFVPILKAAGAQIVVNGHDHTYQHMELDGIHYIISGAGGAKLYNVQKDFAGNGQPPIQGFSDAVHSFTLFDLPADGREMSVQQIDDTGKILDSFTIPHR
ncbi:MAG TPA: metallophosphoesterase [Armatimonadota bacterium]|jgi:hypothetical protein